MRADVKCSSRPAVKAVARDAATGSGRGEGACDLEERRVEVVAVELRLLVERLTEDGVEAVKIVVNSVTRARTDLNGDDDDDDCE